MSRRHLGAGKRGGRYGESYQGHRHANGTPLQLKDILIKARDRHITRQHSYANELVKYEPAEQMTGDPASTLKSRLQDHSNKVAKLNFIAERLVVDAVYDVTPYDLENVGVDLTVDGR